MYLSLNEDVFIQMMLDYARLLDFEVPTAAPATWYLVLLLLVLLLLVPTAFLALSKIRAGQSQRKIQPFFQCQSRLMGRLLK